MTTKHDRAETLRLSIADAEKRIESNPTDDNYVAQQRAKITEWQTELDKLDKDGDEAWFKYRIRPFTFERVIAVRETATLIFVQEEGYANGRKYRKYNDGGIFFIKGRDEALRLFGERIDSHLTSSKQRLATAQRNVDDAEAAAAKFAELKKELGK